VKANDSAALADALNQIDAALAPSLRVDREELDRRLQLARTPQVEPVEPLPKKEA